MKIYVTRPLPETVLQALAPLGEVTTRKEVTPMRMDAMQKVLGEYDIVLPTLRDPLSAEAFCGDIRCKLLANFGVGFNHIDVDAAKARGILVTNTPGAVTDATADIAMMLILMSARRAGEGERAVRANAWDGWHPTQYLGQHVTGKTLGVIGMGRIGKAIAKRCHFGFDMDVVFFNRSKVADCGIPKAQQLPDIASVMGAADFVSISVPGGGENTHLIDAKALSAMKPSAHLINTARGDVVDEMALCHALQSGQIAGAGLDVYENEPEISPPLLEMENVTLLPHLGTASLEVRTDMGLMAVDNIAAFVKGMPCPNLV